MTINPNAAGTVGEPGEFSWTSKDALLYALGVGAGMADPVGSELEFTTENSAGVEQKALPTVGVVLGAGAGSSPDFGSFDSAMLVHGEQSITLHHPIPVSGTATALPKLGGIYDKGKAALVIRETDVSMDGAPLWSTRAALFIRGAGGWGGDSGPKAEWALPEGAPDHVIKCPTRTDQALLYRLNGDRNPLHSDPTFAERAQFPKPILHGLCTFGVTGRVLLHEVCASDPARFKSMSGRFSTPVYPGQELEVNIWDLGDGKVHYRTIVEGNVVLDQGVLTHT